MIAESSNVLIADFKKLKDNILSPRIKIFFFLPQPGKRR
jgi:hypothetical protein